MAFPELIEGIRNFARGFSDGGGIANKGYILDSAKDAPPLEIKGLSEFYDAQWLYQQGYYRMANSLGYGQQNSANQAVNLITAQNLSCCWAGRRLICSTYARLPFQFIQKPSPGQIKYRNDLPIWRVMRQGNYERSGKSLRETMTSHLLFAGNAFAFIQRRSSKKSGGGGTAIDLQMLLPEQVQVKREPKGQRRIMYTVHQPGQSDQVFYVTQGEPQAILHLRGMGNDGLVGYSFLQMARQTLGSSLAMEHNLGRFWAHGGRKPYSLKLPTTTFESDQKAQEYREKWEKRTSDPHAPVILTGTTEMTELGMSMVDAQFLGTRLYSVQEFSRWLGIPPPLLYDLSKSNYATLEPLVRVFINFGLNDWIGTWEGDVERCVLTDEEKAEGIMTRHSLDQIERGDYLTTCQALAQNLVNGWMSRNEAREKMGMEPKPGLDGYTVQLQVVPISEAGNTPQTPDEIEEEEDESEPD